MSYKYEVFLSYGHEPPLCKNWVNEGFYHYFREYLESFVGAKDIIFIDSNIPTGEYWEKNILEALLHSKIMICFWSPSYFDKDSYALKELAIMNYRQQQLGLSTNMSLIMPVLLTKDQDFVNTSKIQYKNFNEYFYKPGLIKNDKRFHTMVKKFADEVDERLRIVPEWKEEMASIDWRNGYSSSLGEVQNYYCRKENQLISML